MPNDVPTTQLFIDGTACAASAGETYRLFNPARPDELVGFAASGTKEDVGRACEAARRAYPAWSRLSYAERAKYLNDVADFLDDDKDDLRYRSTLFCREHGKILAETSMEMSRLGDRFRSTAAYADRLARDQLLAGPPFDTIITRQPLGPAALIVPWNWPLSILGAKLPQALLAGNTVVIKLAEFAAMAPALTVQKIASKFPPGVVNLVTGDAANIGNPLLTNANIRSINFTGSVRVGKHVMRTAAENLIPVTLELGGNDAGLVLDDADLSEAAIQRMYLSAFATSGQICMALKRLYVVKGRYDEVVERMTEMCRRQVVGDGLLPETTMGPINNEKQFNAVISMIEEARSAGSEIRELGEVPDTVLYKNGYFQKPTLVLNPDRNLDIVREEQFGPALPIIRVTDENEAIREANDSRFGLCSSVWTADKQRAVRVARELEAGYTYINDHGPRAQDSRAPFGGFKDSGIGRNLGFEGVIAFQGNHSISGESGWLLERPAK